MNAWAAARRVAALAAVGLVLGAGPAAADAAKPGDFSSEVTSVEPDPGGFTIETAGSPAAAWAALEGREFDVALIDLNYTRDTTSGREGMDLLAKLQALDPTLPVVVMTAWGSVDVAVEAMRRGARSFVQKPWEDHTLVEIVQREIEDGQAVRRRDARVARRPPPESFSNTIVRPSGEKRGRA